MAPRNKHTLSPDSLPFINTHPISTSYNSQHNAFDPQIPFYIISSPALNPTPPIHNSTTPTTLPHHILILRRNFHAMGISRFIGDFLQTLGGGFRAAAQSDARPSTSQPRAAAYDDALLRALITVFGMRENGRIKKERAKGVVEKLGLIQSDEEKARFDLPPGEGGDEVAVEEVIGEMAEEAAAGKRSELLREAFKIFDVDGDGFIDAVELKRVLQCLGLDKGWGIMEIQKMVSVVDVNLDGKVDFGEFQLMMGVKCQ